jgi:type VI secretion system protein
MTRLRVGLFVSVVFASTLSCVTPTRSARLQLEVRVAPDANDDRPVPVDVVFVWDKQMAGKLADLTAKDWFNKKTALRHDDPSERAFTVRDWEWVPGQVVADIDLAVRPAARQWLRAIFVFANYRTEGPHRIRLTPGAATLALLKDDLQTEPIGPSQKAPVTPREH